MTDKILLEKLRHNLDRLHDDLESAEDLDADTREMLADVADDIERSLEGEQDAHSMAERIERLEEATLRFEAKHPRLSQILGDFADTLAKIGM